jgi:hypothetical protein
MVTKLRNSVLYTVLSFAVIIFLLAVFAVVSILYGRSWSHTAVPALLGNRPEVISGLVDGQTTPQPFSFFVVGDTRSSTVFEELYENTILHMVPDFGVILGDFVAYPDLNRHRFFIGEFSAWKMTFPVFLIAGNHDVVTSHETGFNRLKDPVYKEDFEKLYGPTNFSFIYRGCLFIGLNDAYRIDYLDYLKDTLAKRPSDVLMTFVFMHIPPPSLIEKLVQGRQMEGETEFMDLMKAYDVDYVFAGDFHSYFRADKGHTNYIITGGGGSNLNRSAAGSFHHALLMTVDPSKDQVYEVISAIKSPLDPGDDIEISMICGIYPVFEGHPLTWVAVFAVAAAVSAGLIVFLVTRIHRGRCNPRRRRA